MNNQDAPATQTAPQNWIANDNGYRAAEIYWDIKVDVNCPYEMTLRDEWMSGWNSYFEITGKVPVCRLLRPNVEVNRHGTG